MSRSAQKEKIHILRKPRKYSKLILVPAYGYFARDDDGEVGDNTKMQYYVPVEPQPRLSIDSLVEESYLGQRKTLKVYAVECMAPMRDKGRAECFAPMQVRHWLEAHQYIEAVAANMNDYMIRFDYSATEKGKRFLKEHEAPEAWL
jgi:hypothetical protein